MSPDEKALQHLEWPRLQQAVLAHCQSPGAARRGLPLHGNQADAQRALTETQELMALLAEDLAPPLTDLRDLDSYLPRLSSEGSLDGPALADVLGMLGNAARLRRYLSSHRERAPTLQGGNHIDPSLEDLEETLQQALQPDGSLRDDASSELRRLRREVYALRERIIGRIEGLIEKHRDILSDDYYTLREGRYVVPVRRDAHERFHGIVHGTSSSGASIFVEPRGVVEQGNRLKIATGEMERECERILADLSGLVAEQLHALRSAIDCIEHTDAVSARARLSLTLDARAPAFASDGVLDLRAARHPLLVLDGVEVVPNAIEMRAGQALVISGPNAGGKTVALKTAGLCALMVRAGLPIPAGDHSRIPFFSSVLTDLGDEQSTAMNLSTFSAHVRNLSAILERADGASLVLLDELASGTDPQEGAALACGLLDALCTLGATTAITTHYEPVKAFSLQDERLRSASVGLDLERMAPTFTLALDVPGMSSALSVAQRFGIPTAIIEFARGILPKQAQHFERLLRELGGQSQALADARAEVDKERDRLRRLADEQAERLHALKERGKRRLLQETEDLLDEVRKARGQLDDTRRRLKQARDGDADAVRRAEAEVAEVARRVSIDGDLSAKAGAGSQGPAPGKAPPEVRVGMRVFVPRLRSEAQVLEGPRRGQVRVAAGVMKLWVDVEELRDAAAAAERPGATGRGKASPEAPRSRGRTPDNTVTITGLRVDDALPMVESFADRMLTTHDRDGYIVHGHGTGALRSAVREHLAQHMPHVQSWRPATQDEGGEAVTVFTVY